MWGFFERLSCSHPKWMISKYYFAVWAPMGGRLRLFHAKRRRCKACGTVRYDHDMQFVL